MLAFRKARHALLSKACLYSIKRIFAKVWGAYFAIRKTGKPFFKCFPVNKAV
jgi:hypothetical protein